MLLSTEKKNIIRLVSDDVKRGFRLEEKLKNSIFSFDTIFNLKFVNTSLDWKMNWQLKGERKEEN